MKRLVLGARERRAQDKKVSRHLFILVLVGLLAALFLFGCQNQSEPSDLSSAAADSETATKAEEGVVTETLSPLPPADPDTDDPFGVDKNINIGTIDKYIGRSDVAYRDVRMIFDPADFASVGGNPDLATTIEGFEIAPFPLIATLPPLPVADAYDKDTLYTVTWDENLQVIEALPNYEHSEQMLSEMFPKDKAIFLMCGGAGYASATKTLLTHLGWDPAKLYNVGANWEYSGNKGVELISYDFDGKATYYLWRAKSFLFDFTSLGKRLTPYAPGANPAAAYTRPGTGTSGKKACVLGGVIVA
jgi:hypothetical protein